MFKCASGSCISARYLCDLHDDCDDSSDEIGCHNNTDGCSTNNGGCSQKCTDINNRHICSCSTGFQVGAIDKKTCSDVDECSFYDTCSQSCRNTKGSFDCYCVPGYALTAGGRCKALGDAKFLLFASESHIVTLKFGWREAGSIKSINTGIGRHFESKYFSSVFPHYKSRTVYWTDVTEAGIVRAGLRADGSLVNSNVHRLQEIADLSFPSSIAIDWVNDVLFVTDSNNGHIGVSRLDGFYYRVIVDEQDGKPTGLVLLPSKGMMYWIRQIPGSPSIRRSWMDGSNVETILYSSLKWPTSLSIDYSNDNRLYIADTGLGMILSVTWEGHDRQTVILFAMEREFAFSIDVFEQYIYWVTAKTGSLLRQDKFGRGTVENLRSTFTPNSHIAVFQEQRYPEMPSICHGRVCSHLCLRIPDGFTCVCPQGTTFTPNSVNVCDAPIYTEIPPPSVCNCLNGGVCVPGSTVCTCSQDWTGDRCELASGSLTVSTVVIVIVSVFAVCALFLAAVFIYMKRKTGSFLPGSVRRSETDVVSFSNNKVVFHDPQQGDGVAVAIAQNGNGVSFCNPVYSVMEDDVDLEIRVQDTDLGGASNNIAISHEVFNPMYDNQAYDASGDTLDKSDMPDTAGPADFPVVIDGATEPGPVPDGEKKADET